MESTWNYLLMSGKMMYSTTSTIQSCKNKSSCIIKINMVNEQVYNIYKGGFNHNVFTLYKNITCNVWLFCMLVIVSAYNAWLFCIMSVSMFTMCTIKKKKNSMHALLQISLHTKLGYFPCSFVKWVWNTYCPGINLKATLSQTHYFFR